MTVYEGLFVLQLLIFLAITLAKLYNVMIVGKLYDFKISVMLFISTWFMFFIGLIVVLTQPEVTLYVSLFKFEVALIMLNSLFFLIEILFLVRIAGLAYTKRAYNSREAYKAKA